MNRVGAQPVTIARRFSVVFAQQAQRGQGADLRLEQAAQGQFEGLARLPGKTGAGFKPGQAVGRLFSQGDLVGWLGPDQFRNKQGETHGSQGQTGWGEWMSVP